jgi:hypothetical protein
VIEGASSGIAIVAREVIPEQSLVFYQQPQDVVLFDDQPALPADLYVTKPMADAILGGPLAAAKAGAAGRSVTGKMTGTVSAQSFSRYQA